MVGIRSLGNWFWSTVVVEDGRNAKVAAYNTATEEFGQYNAPDKAFFMVDHTITSRNILVLDDGAAKALGLAPGDLTKLKSVPGCYTDTIMISRAARGAGFEIVLAPSAVDPTGANVAHILNPIVLGR